MSLEHSPARQGKREGKQAPAGQTIAAFCADFSMSKAAYFNLRKLGLGPDETRVNGLVRITDESSRKWKRRFTQKGIARPRQRDTAA